MNAMVLPVLAALLAFGAVMLVSLAVVDTQRRAGMRRSLALALGDPLSQPASGTGRPWEATSTLDTIVVGIGSRLVSPRGKERLRRHLAWAGRPSSESLSTIIGRKVIYLIGGACVGLLLGVLLGGWWVLLLPALAVAGFFAPDLILYNQADHRTQEIQYQLPDALDLLNLCVESGLGLQAALARVAETQEGPVAAEFGRVLQEMQLGVSRTAAFESMAARTKQDDLRRFVTAMLQVDKLGIPVANVLREQAREMRAVRHARAREQAQKVPVKILGPLMLCFLPGLFIIILGPAAITAVDVLLRR